MNDMGLMDIFIFILKVWVVFQLIGIGFMVLRAMRPVIPPLLIIIAAIFVFPTALFFGGFLKLIEFSERLAKPSEMKRKIGDYLFWGSALFILIVVSSGKIAELYHYLAGLF